MPDLKTHLAIDRLFLGKEFPEIHKTKDYPSRWMGSSHRRVLHDSTSNWVLALVLYPDDRLDAYASAQLHDHIDRVFSRPSRRRKGKT